MGRGRFAVLLVVVFSAAAAVLPMSALAAFGPAKTLATFGSGAGQVVSPAGIAVTEDGTAYVADFNNSRIDVFAPAGGFLFAFGKGVNSGSGDPNVCTTACQSGVQDFSANALWGPASVGLDASGNVYAASFGGFRIDVFSPAGEFLYAFGLEVNPTLIGSPDECTLATGCKQGSPSGGAGSLTNPNGIGIDPDTGLVYVANTNQNRINVYTTAGVFEYAFGKGVNAGAGNPNVCESQCQDGVASGSAGGMARPGDVKVTPDGRLAVADEDNHRIDIFTAAGEFKYAFGHEVDPSGANICTTECQAAVNSSGAGALKGASAEAIDEAGMLYVSDPDRDRVSEFELDGTFVRAFGEGVLDGSPAFQVCTTATGCREGGEGSNPGSVVDTFGVATFGPNVLVSSEGEGSDRVEVFGEVVPPTTPIPTPPTPSLPTPKPSNKFSIGKLKLDQEKGTGMLSVKVQAAGKLVLKGKGIRQVKVTTKRAGMVKFAVKLVGAAQRTLLKDAVSKVTAKVTFTPTGGDPLTHTKKLTLKAALPK